LFEAVQALAYRASDPPAGALAVRVQQLRQLAQGLQGPDLDHGGLEAVLGDTAQAWHGFLQRGYDTDRRVELLEGAHVSVP
jgi:hypothetical protein